jgi:hypothetical protein
MSLGSDVAWSVVWETIGGRESENQGATYWRCEKSAVEVEGV